MGLGLTCHGFQSQEPQTPKATRFVGFRVKGGPTLHPKSPTLDPLNPLNCPISLEFGESKVLSPYLQHSMIQRSFLGYHDSLPCFGEALLHYQPGGSKSTAKGYLRMNGGLDP